jgi:hypothetical protein
LTRDLRYRIDPDGLGEVRDYFDHFWTDVLAALKDAIERGEGNR